MQLAPMRFLRGRLRLPCLVMNEPAINPSTHVLTVADFNFNPPSLLPGQLQSLAASHFKVTGAYKALEGERDQNCRITTADGRKFVLKVSSAGEDPAVVDFQVQALLHIAEQDAPLPVPRMVRGSDGEMVYWTSSDKGKHMVRMLT